MEPSRRPETLVVHVGADPDPATGAIVPPLDLATTFVRNEAYALPSPYLYGRYANPVRERLEAALAQLEGGATAAAFASGLAAATCALQAVLAPGGHVVLADGVYGGVRSLVQSVFGAWGVHATFVDQGDVAAVRDALRRQPTQLLWLESPSNPMWRLADIAACAAEARAVGARTLVDNTVATPLLQQPLALGADLVLHATTKYVGGHSDVTGGALVLREDGPLAARVRELQKLAGAVPSPFDCWLLLRGLRTLAVRVERQSASALAVAGLLAGLPSVTAVHYPWLAAHPQHALARRQMRAGSGMVSFEVGGGAPAALAVAGRLRLFARATSLGGVESLVEHRKTVESPDTPTPDGLLRLSIGLEHVEDLCADLRQALAS